MQHPGRGCHAAPIIRPRGRHLLRRLAPGVLALLGSMPWPGALGAVDDLAPGTFVLDTEVTQRVTLRANGAPLAEILAELGNQLGIEIRGAAPAGSPVTANFSRLPLPDALRRLTDNYMALSDESTGRIARIILLPKADGPRYVPPAAVANEGPDAELLGGPDVDPMPLEDETLDDPTIDSTSGGGIDFDPDEAASNQPLGEEPDDSAESWQAEMEEDLRDD